MAKSAINFIDTRLNNRATKFVIGFGIFLLAAGSGLFGFYSYGKLGPDRQQVAGSSTTQTLPKDWLQKYFGTDNENDVAVGGPSGDPDGDLLSNLEEYTFGTDPTNPDTDGDGALDGVEVSFNNNPNGSGPLEIPQVHMDDLIKSLGPEYDKYSEENLKKQVGDFFQTNRDILPEFPEDNELITSTKNDVSSFEKYYEDTASLGQLDATERQNISDNLFSMNPSELDSYIAKLQAIEKVLKETPVPSQLVNIHKLKIAQVRAGIRMFELIKDEYSSSGSNQQFWPDYYYQMVASQEAHALEIAAWKQLYNELKAKGEISQPEPATDKNK